jgi:uncharacterized protein YceK
LTAAVTHHFLDLFLEVTQVLKHIIVIVFIILITGCAGSMTRIADSEKTIHVTNEIPGRTQQQILESTKQWMEKHFTAQPDPIAFADQNAGLMSGNGQIDYPCSWADCVTKGNWQVSFSMRIDAQDGVIKTSFRNIQLYSPESGPDRGMNSPVWAKRDMDAIRPKLLELNRKLIQFLSE